DLALAAECALLFGEHRRGAKLDRAPRPLDPERKRPARTGRDDALHLGEAFDRLAVDRDHEIARLEAGDCRRAARRDFIDARGNLLLAVPHRDAGEDHDGKQKIRDGTRGHDRGALPYRLVIEALPTILLA